MSQTAESGTKQKGPQDKGTEERGLEKLEAVLPTSLAVVTGLLTTLGGVTGGYARMFRNQPFLAYVTLGLAIAAIVLALTAQLLGREPLRRHRWLMAVSLSAFSASLLMGTVLAVETAGQGDRPGLTAKLTQSASGTWFLEGTATASGMEADGSLRVFIYAKAAGRGQPITELFHVTAGPNSEGVARQPFTVPLPAGAHRSFVVTAAVDGEVRWCNGVRVEIGSNLTPVSDPSNEGDNSCAVVLPPQDPSPTPTFQTPRPAPDR